MSGKSNSDLIRKVLEQEISLDIETLGTNRGSGIVELSLYDPNTKTVHQYRVSPNLTVAEASIKFQDVSGFRATSRDVLAEHPLVRRARELEVQGKIGGIGQPKRITWKDTIVAQVLMDDSLGDQGLFYKKIQGSFGKGNAPALTVHSFDTMSEKDFLKVFEEIQVITHTQEKFFKQGVEESSPFLRRAYAENPYFQDLITQKNVAGRTATRRAGSKKDKLGRLREDLAKYSGIDDLTLKVKDVDSRQLVNELAKQIENKSVQIAFSQFESKQIGALVGSFEADIQRRLVNKEITKFEAAAEKQKLTGIRSVLAETPTGISDIMPISGEAVNKARAAAQITGDYTGLFRPMLEEMASGKKARVSDILDLTRIQTSYEQKLGLTPFRTPNVLSVDVAQRLYGFSEGIADSLTKIEKHIGAFDTLSQSALTRSSLSQIAALAEVAEGTEEGARLIQQAKNKQGDLFKALTLASVKREAAVFSEEANIMTRLSRAAENLLEKGFSPETSGSFKRGSMKTRMTAEGKAIQVASAQPTEYLRMKSLDEVLQHIKTQPNYQNADINKAVGLFMDSINKPNQAPLISFDEQKQSFRTTAAFDNLKKGDFKNAENIKRKYLQDSFDQLSKKLGQGLVPGLSAESIDSYIAGIEKRSLSKNSFLARHGGWKHIDFSRGKTAGLMAAGISAVGMLGAVGNMLSNIGIKQQRGGPETLRTMTYDRWFEANSQFHGMESQKERGSSGFSERGMGAVQRKQRTDFGSPYQGPMYSQYVLDQQKLLSERQKYEMNMFAHTHFSNEGVIGNYINSVMMSKDSEFNLNSFIKSISLSSRLMASGNKFATEGQFVSGDKYGGLQGQNLFKVDLSKYRISATDADTIVLKRKGTGNPIAQFFGMDNDSISVRLAGIDAPELPHGEKEGQPLANRALGRLRAMMNQGKNLELLIDPTNITYGRQVGSLFVDGQNVQMDLIKSGDARFLNYKRKGQSQFNPMIYSKMSRLAADSSAGIHGDPYFQPLLEFEKRSKQSITFNTMVNIPKVAQNSNLMSLYGIMNAADSMGMYTPDMAREAAALGERTTTLSGDFKNPITIGKGNQPHKDYINYLAYDNTTLMKTRGSQVSNRMQSSSGYGNLDKKLSLDTAGTSTSSYTKRRYQVFDSFGTDKQMKMRRKISMQALQQRGLRQMSQSPIGHHRM